MRSGHPQEGSIRSCMGCICMWGGGPNSTIRPLPSPPCSLQEARLALEAEPPGAAAQCPPAPKLGRPCGRRTRRNQCPEGRSCKSSSAGVCLPRATQGCAAGVRGPRAPTHLHAVVEGSQGLRLVVLGEGSAQTAVPLIPLCTGAVGVNGSERGCMRGPRPCGPRSFPNA